VCEYFRKEIAQPNLHEHTDRFIKYIWSVFFFVLTCNLLGLLPIAAVSSAVTEKLGIHGLHLGGTPTGNIWVTATLAILTFLMMVINGVRLGGRHYFAHFCPGPLWLAPILVPVEITGVLAKAFALTVRLFANMVAGHVLLAVLLGFILSAGTSMGYLGGFGIAIPAVAGSIAVTLLEIFVAFLQAFIFAFLTTLFIGQSVVFHHGGPGELHEEGAH
jgi:F-type H+-transporting ATPase subunit a